MSEAPSPLAIYFIFSFGHSFLCRQGLWSLSLPKDLTAALLSSESDGWGSVFILFILATILL